ncbi:MAG TPA: GNAT family N-acetyltransferase [Pyrinomonadaceae bacterium]
MNIKLANSNDAPTLAELRYRFRSITDADQESEADFLERCTSWMSQRLRSENWICWVAKEDQDIIGTLWLELIEKIPNPTNEPELNAYVTNVFVDESARGKGIGSQLLETAIEFCKQRKIHSMILWPSEMSRSLYQRHGFNVSERLFELNLTT